MKICFIVAEFNPLHNGHKFFIDEIRKQGFSHIIAVMSSNFVQRGEPAIFSKETRTKMALENGIDLVIELPTKWSMSTAQRYAFSAMKIANSLGVVDAVCFGSECGNINLLDKIAKVVGREEFELYLKKQLLRGLTFAKARQNALEEFFSYEDLDIKNIISKPNNILAIEYLKALRELNSDIKISTIKRCENSKKISSASDIRRLLINRSDLYKNYVPEKVIKIVDNQNNNFAVLENAEQAIVYSLKNTDRLNFLKVADVSEGIENRILDAANKFRKIDEILNCVKTKRYTMSRIKRIVLSNFLNISEKEQKDFEIEFIKVLGTNESGLEILKKIKERSKVKMISNFSDVSKLDKKSKELFYKEEKISDIYNTFFQKHSTGDSYVYKLIKHNLYNDAIYKIKSLEKFGSKPGLKRIKRLLNLIGNPQDKLKCIHIAGTNGKGSTCCFVSSVLKESGYKVGLYSSPSIYDFRERIQVNGEKISKSEICSLIEFFESHLKDKYFENDPVTEFELVTAMAFKYFFNKNCDYVVLETGMGGTFDATNVISKPICAAVTSISLDHTHVLGSTEQEIAKEKLGIMKKNSKIVLADNMQDFVYDLAQKMAKKLDCKVYRACLNDVKNISSGIDSGTEFEYRNLKLRTKFLGEHQVQNISTALKTLETIEFAEGILLSGIKKGFLNASLPCRLEIVSKRPLIILDGAHNPAGAKTLLNFIEKYLKNRKIIGVVGMLKDKDYEGVFSKLAPVFSKIFTVMPKGNSRALSLEKITEVCKIYNENTFSCQNISSALKLALESSSEKDSAIIVFGSFSIMNNIKREINKLNVDKI